MNLRQQKEGYFMLTRATRFCLSVVLVLLASFTTAAAQETVAQGTDYFTTVPGFAGGGTNFNFGMGIPTVDFQSAPIGSYQGLQTGPYVDTIVQRQADATLNMGSVPIQLLALSLASTAPVLVGGNPFNVSLTLDQSHLAQDVGTITIMGNATGGTFTSSLECVL